MFAKPTALANMSIPTLERQKLAQQSELEIKTTTT
ncbi:hypothetical protein F441_16785 [Phytophthora nicotianae CJ01A1]|uniref:Uncharacterized protein n=6 Tax=Phytophthora nicotianae TaxID=4792 RepID=W2PQF8_PHYN3|nr:hypothetical protein PPTG_23927 [Phytophthora nicotianae INRA-310]ETI37041.1 hypothetical protein F443_16936 [Phytophthora nicotianae P1569]ETK77258.1 hypothetical protein L915_16466 [Phytophthora nicotianae]ETO65773.1 hypothetical protein F444_16959 [Phytophthora nicotianae P1976]ETP06859.1 hypothetical protein F441_16785 [Phytophthora nicotianae CJ01A1]ETP34972.1 hypothetical protein F442_16779 [Phytophthora nicotianae P10297]